MVQDIWTSPADPQPGQQVRQRSLIVNANGTPQQDVEFLYTMPTDPVPYHGDPSLFATTGELIDVEYPTNSWSDQKDTSIVQALPGTLTVSSASATGSLQSQIATGDWSKVGTSVIDGQPVIELSETNPGGNLLLWVNAQTYLPVRETLGYTAGGGTDQVNGSIIAEYQYLAPSTTALTNLQPTIPPGFTETTTPPTHPGG